MADNIRSAIPLPVPLPIPMPIQASLIPSSLVVPQRRILQISDILQSLELPIKLDPSQINTLINNNIPFEETLRSINQPRELTENEISRYLSRFEIRKESKQQVLSSIVFDNERRFTPNEINIILNIKDDQGEPMLSINNKEFVYEIINMFIERPFDEVVQYLEGKPAKSETIFNYVLFDSSKRRFMNEINSMSYEAEVEEGVIECPSCHQHRTRYVQVQTRSGDESFTTFASCIECGYQWRAS